MIDSSNPGGTSFWLTVFALKLHNSLLYKFPFLKPFIKGKEKEYVLAYLSLPEMLHFLSQVLAVPSASFVLAGPNYIGDEGIAQGNVWGDPYDVIVELDPQNRSILSRFSERTKDSEFLQTMEEIEKDLRDINRYFSFFYHIWYFLCLEVKWRRLLSLMPDIWCS